MGSGVAVPLFYGFKHFSLVGRGWQRSIDYCVSRKATGMGQELAEKESA